MAGQLRLPEFLRVSKNRHRTPFAGTPPLPAVRVKKIQENVTNLHRRIVFTAFVELARVVYIPSVRAIVRLPFHLVDKRIAILTGALVPNARIEKTIVKND